MTRCTTPTTARRAHWAIAAALCLAALCLAPLAPGQGPAPARELPRESAKVVAMAQTLVHDRDPEVRGEAVLLLAASRDLPAGGDVFGVALRASKDPAPAARLRGILALGLLGETGVEVRLAELLGGEPSTETEAAALALGMLADSHPGIAVEAYFTKFEGSSYRRQRGTLLAMLVGLGLEPHPSKIRALQDLFDDDALKHPDVRILLYEALGAVAHGLTDEDIDEMVEHRDARIRALGARWTVEDTEPSESRLATLEKLAQRDPDENVRAAALDALTRARHLPALEIAAKAATSRDPIEAAQGMRSAARLGGGAMSQALEDRILSTRRPALQAALMAALPGPWTDRYLETCAELAIDTRRPADLRCAAALTLAAAGNAEAAPILRTLFASQAGRDHLPALARALIGLTTEPPALDHLHPEGKTLDAERLEALLAAGHEGAAGAWLEAFARADAPRAALLRAWRRGLSLHRMPPSWRLVPDGLVPLL